MKTLKRISLVSLVLLIVLFNISSFAAATVVKMYNEGAAGDASRFKNTDEGSVAVMLNVKGGKFIGLEIPSWYNAPSSTVILLYKWDTDYKTTMGKGPIFSDLIEDMDNAGWVEPGQRDFKVNFERAFAEGKYLLVYRKADKYALHIPTHSAFADSVAYFDGEVYENISYQVSCVVDPDATLNEKTNVKVEVNLDEVVVPLYSTGASSDGLSYIGMNTYDSVAQKFTVAGGKLVGFMIDTIFIESGSAEIEVYVYKWNENYADTVKTAPIYINKFEAETEGVGSYFDFKMPFERAYAEGDYLVKLVSLDSVNLWCHAAKNNVTSYLDEDKYETGNLKLSCIINDKVELDERPFEMATPEPTQEPTTSPVATQDLATSTPKTTSAPKNDIKSDNKTGLIIAGIALVVVVIIVVLLIIKKKKK